MKRCLCALLCAALLLGLVACGGKSTEVKTWQEQYELGIRYLSEGNYKEAILAFTAAIRIDPKQVSVYEKLAEAYTQSGDAENAVKILSDGLAATGSDTLKVLLEQLQAALPGMTGPDRQPGTANGGSPGTPPAMPVELAPESGWFFHELDGGSWEVLYEEKNYLPFRQEWAAAVEPLIAAGVSGDKDTAKAALQTVTTDWILKNFAQLQDKTPGIYMDGRNCSMEFWTLWNGDLIWICFLGSDGTERLIMEYRPAGGTGFSACLQQGGTQLVDYKGLDYEGFAYLSGETKGWLFDGAISHTIINRYGQDVRRACHDTGYASAERFHGEYVSVVTESDAVTTYRSTFENGLLVNAYTRPTDGWVSYAIRETVWADGRAETEYYLYAGSPNNNVYCVREGCPFY